MNKGLFGFPKHALLRQRDPRWLRNNGQLPSFELDFSKPGCASQLATMQRFGAQNTYDIDTTYPRALYCRFFGFAGNCGGWFRPLPAGDFEAYLDYETLSGCGGSGVAYNMVGMYGGETLSGAGNNWWRAVHATNDVTLQRGATSPYGQANATDVGNYAGATGRMRVRVRRASSTWTVSWSMDGFLWSRYFTFTPGGTQAFIGFAAWNQDGITTDWLVHSFRIWEPTMPDNALGRGMVVPTMIG